MAAEVAVRALTAAPRSRLAAAAARPLRTTVVVIAWVPMILFADRGASYPVQCGLGIATWILLCALLRREDVLTRAQVAVVVAYATLIEFTFSGLLHVYDYRLHEHAFLARVPWFVPPGHGLVYLAALCFGRDPWVRKHAKSLVSLTLVIGAGWAVWGLALAPRRDVLGALWFGCLVWFLLRGRQPLVYVGAFIVVSWLEFLGTGLGTWTWATHSPTGIIPMGNPPADAAGGYGFFDAAALFVGPWLACQAAAVRTMSSRSV